MTANRTNALPIEAERYELHNDSDLGLLLDRRDFFKVLGSGILVFLVVPGSRGQESGRRGEWRDRPDDVAGWLHIDDAGRVRVYTGKVEVGQNIRTSLTQAVAEELPVPIERVDLVMGDTRLTPYDSGTFGSRTTPSMAPQLRRVAATAREILFDLAAERLEVSRDSLRMEGGSIRSGATDRRISLGELARGQELTREILDDGALTASSDWDVAGKSVPKINGRDFVTGRHRYASDIKLEGMLHGKVLRPPRLGAKLRSVDTSLAEAIEGVQVVRDGEFVGVVAPTQHAAGRAIGAIRAKWTSPEASTSHDELFDYLKRHPTERRGWRGSSAHEEGSIEKGLEAADQKVSGRYTVAYIAHAPLEPRAAVAVWEGKKIHVWTGTQRPFGVHQELMDAFDLAPDQAHVEVPDTGSAYGGKHTGEAAVEAARLAKAAGAPVKLVWTRDEEFTWAYFRPAGLIEVQSGVRKDGEITAWDYRNFNSGGSAIGPLYTIPNQRVAFQSCDYPLRQGSYRGLAATANHFAREVHVDEIAHAVGVDPLELRRKNLDDARLVKVLESAAKAFGWKAKKSESSRGFGIAGGFEKGSYIATCVEVAVESDAKSVALKRIVAAFDCGAVVNPDHLKNQVEGAIAMGIGGALYESIHFRDGKILNPRFSKYRVPRFGDVAPIEVVLIDRHDVESAGAGETPIVAIAPAISNAIFDACGVRLRSMPMMPSRRAMDEQSA